MKVAICGDVHFGAIFGLGKPNSSGGNTRLDDYENTFNYIVDKCVELGVDAFVQTGDLFEKRNPSPIEIGIADRCIRRLSSANIATFIIMGNHDYKRHAGTYTSSLSSLPAKHYPSIRILTSPETVFVSNKVGERINLALMPFRDKRMYSVKGTKECSEAYEEEVWNMLEESNKKFPTIFVGHNFFYEGSYNQYGGSEVLIKPDAFRNYNAAFMGHLHGSRKVNKNCYYTGSMERNNFGEAGETKYFFIYDTVTDSVSKHEIPTRGLKNIEFSTKAESAVDAEKEIFEKIESFDLSDKIVKAKFFIKESVISMVSKNKIESKLYERGCYFLSRLILESTQEEVVRDLSPLKSEGDFELFKKFLESQNLTDSKKESLIKKASEIMG